MSRIIIIPDNKKKAIEFSIKVIRKGGLAILPTDTTYGFSGDYFNSNLRKRIFNLKKRSLNKNFIVLCSNIDSLIHFSKQNIPSLILDSLPASLTLVVKNIHEKIYNEPTIAIRIPPYFFLLDLLKNINLPLISTSVNISGKVDLKEINEILDQFKDLVDLIVIDKNLIPSYPSTILDISKKPFRIIRQGTFQIDNEWLDLN